MANTKVTGDLIASLTIAKGNIADNAVPSDKISGIQQLMLPKVLICIIQMQELGVLLALVAMHCRMIVQQVL